MPSAHANERPKREPCPCCTMQCIVGSTRTLISPPPQQRAEIVHRRVSVGGRPTIVHELAATVPCKLQIMVVPGNPGSSPPCTSHTARQYAQSPDRMMTFMIQCSAGMSGFYLPFMRALHEGLDGAASLSAITHLGLGGLSAGKIFGLEEQIEHKRDYLEEYLLRPGSPPCALIGHSIGAHNGGGQLRRTTASSRM